MLNWVNLTRILKWRKLCLKMWLYVAISENMRFSCFLPNSSVFIPSYLFLRDVSKWFSEKRVIAFLSLFLIEVFFNLWDRRIPSSLIKIRNIQWKRSMITNDYINVSVCLRPKRKIGVNNWTSFEWRMNTLNWCFIKKIICIYQIVH